MSLNGTQASAREIASLLRWWEAAGVDLCVEDSAMPWLGRSVAPVIPVADARPKRDHLPDTLAGLIDWMMSAENLGFAGPERNRILPFGTAGAPLMILIDMPEMQDEVALLTGEVGQLFDNMLKAMGLNRDSVYCASLCPGRPAGGRLASDQLVELGRVARHHMRLAAPKYVWLLGQATSRAIFGADVAQESQGLRSLNQEGHTMVTIASMHPRLLIQNPKRKALVWADMQMLMGELNT